MLASDPSITQAPHLTHHIAQEDSVNSFRVSAPGSPPSEDIPSSRQQRISAPVVGSSTARPAVLNPTMLDNGSRTDLSVKEGTGTPPQPPVATNPATTSPPLPSAHAQHPSALATTVTQPPQGHYASVHSPTTYVAPNVTEADFHHTRQYIPHVSHPALVAVVQSMLDEAPQLTHVIRAKCENAVASLAATLAVHSPLSHGAPATAPAFHYSPTPAGFAPHYPPEHAPPSAPASGRQKEAHSNPGRPAPSRPRREEEYEMCQVHGNMRATKHLTFNHTSQQVECISGFHCLESAPAAQAEKVSPVTRSPEKNGTDGTPTSGGGPGAFNPNAVPFNINKLGAPKLQSPSAVSGGAPFPPGPPPASAPASSSFLPHGVASPMAGEEKPPQEQQPEASTEGLDVKRIENLLMNLKNQ